MNAFVGIQWRNILKAGAFGFALALLSGATLAQDSDADGEADIATFANRRIST
ncbi:MAG: hypothetical protein IPK89_10360 [Sphingomonadales bacterium]|nr:hypothetical protein [Sphingomonadales bacterium]